ncbi:MAG: hypothetical protein JWP11_45 [Frankiales bacterium]|nr:hypothetical protein [Frankiales bacterium]
MSITQTPRFGIDRAGAGTDPFGRGQLLDFIDNVESTAARSLHGAIGDRPAAAAAEVDTFFTVTDAAGGGVVGTVYYCTGATWLQVNRLAKTVRITHTFNISGPVDLTTVIPGMVFDVPAGQSVTLVRARHGLVSGGTATVKLQHNGADIADWTGIAVTTAETLLDTTDVAIADGDRLSLVPTALAGATPTGLYFSAAFDYTV